MHHVISYQRKPEPAGSGTFIVDGALTPGVASVQKTQRKYIRACNLQPNREPHRIINRMFLLQMMLAIRNNCGVLKPPLLGHDVGGKSPQNHKVN